MSTQQWVMFGCLMVWAAGFLAIGLKIGLRYRAEKAHDERASILNDLLDRARDWESDFRSLVDLGELAELGVARAPDRDEWDDVYDGGAAILVHMANIHRSRNEKRSRR